MKIFLAADHNGFEIKNEVRAYLERAGIAVEDMGDEKLDPADDFQIYAARAVTALLGRDDADPRAILICGSGQGMMIAANRFKGIRAGLGWSVEAARGIRNDEDSNVLALPSQILNENRSLAHQIIDTWLETPFAGATRYIRRNKALDTLA